MQVGKATAKAIPCEKATAKVTLHGKTTAKGPEYKSQGKKATAKELQVISKSTWQQLSKVT